MERIVIYIEGDLEEISKKETTSPDTIVDTLAHDIEDIAKNFGLTSYVEDVYYLPKPEVCNCNAQEPSNIKQEICENCKKPL